MGLGTLVRSDHMLERQAEDPELEVPLPQAAAVQLEPEASFRPAAELLTLLAALEITQRRRCKLVPEEALAPESPLATLFLTAVPGALFKHLLASRRGPGALLGATVATATTQPVSALLLALVAAVVHLPCRPRRAVVATARVALAEVAGLRL